MAAELRESQKEIKSLSNSASPSAPRDTSQEERKSLLLKAVEKAGGGGLAAKEMYGAPPPYTYTMERDKREGEGLRMQTGDPRTGVRAGNPSSATV